MKKSHRTSRAVFLFCFCCDARSMQATFGDLTNANVWLRPPPPLCVITKWMLPKAYFINKSFFNKENKSKTIFFIGPLCSNLIISQLNWLDSGMNKSFQGFD